MERTPFFAFLDGIATHLRASNPFGPDVDPLPLYLLFAALLGLGLLAAYLLRGARLRQARRKLTGADGLRERVAVAETRAERLPELEQMFW